METQLQAIATVLSLMNPAMCASIFARVTMGRSKSEKQGAAAKAALVILVILTLAALYGSRVLQLFGVSLDAFSVAGGGVLVWMGSSMLRSQSKHQPEGSETDTKNISLSPLILFAASPGTITGVITLSVAQTGTKIPVAAVIAIGVAVLTTWISLMIVSQLGARKSDGGLFRETVTSFMGLIVIAMGVQFSLSGIQSFLG